MHYLIYALSIACLSSLGYASEDAFQGNAHDTIAIEAEDVTMKQRLLANWFDGFNQRDWDAIQQLYSFEALIHSKDGPMCGGDAVVEIAQRWIEAVPDAKITPLFLGEEGDVVVAHWRFEGTLVGPIRDIRATGDKVVCHGITCFRCHAGEVIEHWACVDYRSLAPSAL